MDCTNCSHCCEVDENVDFLWFEFLQLLRLYYDMKLETKIKFKIRGIVVQVHLPCPFLKDHRCSIYDQRPLLCRAYPLKTISYNNQFVTIIHQGCKKNQNVMAEIDQLKNKISLSEVLKRLKFSTDEIHEGLKAMQQYDSILFHAIQSPQLMIAERQTMMLQGVRMMDEEHTDNKKLAVYIRSFSISENYQQIIQSARKNADLIDNLLASTMKSYRQMISEYFSRQNFEYEIDIDSKCFK